MIWIIIIMVLGGGMSQLKYIFFIMLFTNVNASLASTVVFSHLGSNDPTTEGWIVEPVALVLGDRPTVGPVINDNGTGNDAWSIDDNSTFLGTNYFYTQSPGIEDNNQAKLSGWTLNANLRIGDNDDSVGNAGSIILEFADGATSYRMAFGSQSNGDPTILLWDGGTDGSINATGTEYILQNGGAGYHSYEMVYSPVANSVDLFIDGVERISDYGGVESTLFNRVAWGSASSSDTGLSNWNSVEWSVTPVPIPATLPLLISGLLGLSLCKKRGKYSN